MDFSMKKRRLTVIFVEFLLITGALTESSPYNGMPPDLPQTPDTKHVLTLDRIFLKDPPLDGLGLKEIHWSEDGSKVGSLRPSAENRDVLELWVYDAVSGRSVLLVRATDILAHDSLKLSDEMIQVLERKRISQRGITSYHWSPDGRSILFPLGGGLYVYNLETARPILLDDGDKGPILDPRFSPDGRSVSFVRQGELWIIPSEGGTPRRVTQGSTETLTHGLAEFVAQEEMGRYRGYWWSPDAGRIAYLEVDESDVQVLKRASYRSSGASVSEQRYPGAGKANAKVRVGILDLSSMETVWLDLGNDVEYIARVDWEPGGRFLAIQVQPRDQRWLRLVFADPIKAETRTILVDKAESFVNLHDDLTFLDGGGFLWSSERSGIRQLYLYDASGNLLRKLTDDEQPVLGVEAVDEEARKVYYSAVTNRSLERHLFSVSLEGGEPKRLTQEAGWHRVTVSEKGRHYVDCYSSILAPSRVTLHDATGKKIAVLDENPTPELDLCLLSKPEFIEITSADGATQLNAIMIKPPDFDPSVRYPVLIYGYGGPHGHVVADRWSRSMLWNQFLTQHGYIVFSIDPRGANYRGKKFEDEIYRRLGIVEVEDHVAAVDYLRSLPYVDSRRIGIWGWSYGGTLTLMLLLGTEGYFRCGIAVAPVTDWHWYDTHYTERYLGLPDESPDVYSQAAPIEQDPAGLTEDLLLIHGMADDNVFLRHSLAFAQKLQQSGVQFDLMFYPGKTHSIAGKRTRRHLYGLMFEFLETHLKTG